MKGRNTEVLKFIENPYCIQKNAGGEPAHPLYLKKSLHPTLLCEPADKYENLTKILAEQEDTANRFEKEPSKHIFSTFNPSRSQIRYEHRLKHFANDEALAVSLKISDGQVIFNQSDELLIGKQTIYWYISRVGEFYTKSNGEFDAEHIGEEFIIQVADIKTWRAVVVDEVCYLELETDKKEIYSSVHIPVSEQQRLFDLQRHLNQLTKASR